MSVPVAVRDGRITGEVRGSVTGRYGYDVPVRGRVVHVSALARALAAPQRPHTAAVPAVALGISAFLALWNLQLVALNPGGGSAWFGLLFFAAIAAGSGWLLRVRQRRLRVLGPLVDNAMMLWRVSWYCRRCGVVSVYGPGEPVAVAASGLAGVLVSMAESGRRQNGQSARPRSAGVRQ
ncbi:hypothetical protein [Actinoplanes sp. NBRC 103695]|uniref:hypothetical protein n=1 Tax=Actinoplanes sp. NBRC 103695 TaxID=3032202 RepID=UPI002552BF4F|nr:hypothetical protein [Actinoplanes sp. NBRC 103695]